MDEVETPFTTKSKANAEDLRHYEVFPEEKIQQKIDLYFSPYNKVHNFKRWMNFERNDESPDGECQKAGNPNDKWQRISELILNKEGSFLRKSLRCINKAKYEHYEEISKSMVKIKPRRSPWQDQHFYRIQSIRQSTLASQRRASFASACHTIRSRSILSPIAKRFSERTEEKEDKVNEENISKVVSIMKMVQENSRSQSPTSESSYQGSEVSSTKQNKDLFQVYLDEIRQKINKKIVVEEQEQRNTLLRDLEWKFPEFKPIGRTYSTTARTTKSIPMLKVLSDDHLSIFTRDPFSSEKNISKNEFLDKPISKSTINKNHIIQTGEKCLQRKRNLFVSPHRQMSEYKFQKIEVDECNLDPETTPERTLGVLKRNLQPIRIPKKKFSEMKCMHSPGVTFKSKSKKSLLKNFDKRRQSVSHKCKSVNYQIWRH
jgi:hypothetical protein